MARPFGAPTSAFVLVSMLAALSLSRCAGYELVDQPVSAADDLDDSEIESPDDERDCIRMEPSTSDRAPSVPLEGKSSGTHLWTARIETNGFVNELVLTSKGVALVADDTAYQVDQHGTVTTLFSGHFGEPLSPLVGFLEDHLAAVGNSLYVYATSSGMVQIPGNPSFRPEKYWSGSFVAAAPDGALIVKNLDWLSRIDLLESKLEWSVQLPKEQEDYRLVGLGNAVAIAGPFDEFYDVKTGRKLKLQLEHEEQQYSPVFAGPEIGIVGRRQEFSSGTVIHTTVLFDHCGRIRHELPAFYPWLLGADDSLIGSMDEDVYILSKDAERMAGPVRSNDPHVIGGDGTIYTFRCEELFDDSSSASIVAYDSTFSEKWSIDLGPSCKGGSGVISEDGVLYYSRQGKQTGTIEVIAVQTDSPGMLKSGWPGRFGNGKAQRWTQ